MLMPVCRIRRALVLGVISSVALSSVAFGAGNRKNVILIMADDLGYETISANGGESYRTPVLERLAEQGTRFEHCYSQPLCTPSRVKIMTGKYNVRNYTRFGTLPSTEVTFANILQNAGYATLVAGKWQLSKNSKLPHEFGFDQSLLWQVTTNGRVSIDGKKIDKRFENPVLEKNGVITEYSKGEYSSDLMVDFINEFIEENREQPFLVYFPMNLTHCPFVPTPDSADWDPTSIGSESYKGDAKYFGDMVAYMDKMIGRIVDKLEEEGLTEDTIILFTGDNGTDQPVVSKFKGREVPGAKGDTIDAGTRVPLIVAGAGVKRQVISDLVDFSDFLPTICEFAEVPIPEGLAIDGRSFLPRLLGDSGNPREWVYCWYSKSGKDKGARVFARTQEFKLYRSGEFYAVANDPEELNPLPQSSLTEEQMKTKSMLQEVINSYEGLRNSEQ